MVPIETVVGEILRDLLAYHFDEAIPQTSAGQQVIDRIVSALKNEKVVAFGRLSVSDFFVPVPSAFWSANWLFDLGIHGEGDRGLTVVPTQILRAVPLPYDEFAIRAADIAFMRIYARH